MHPSSDDLYDEVERALKRGDRARLRALYEELANIGEMEGFLWLGDVYARGDGVPVDLDKAELLFNQAAALGSSEAVFQMASVWLDRGEPHRYFLAIQEATNKGVLVAQYYLGLCYKRGRGTEIDTSRAEELIRDAAERGLIRAKTYFARKRILRIYNPFGFAYGLVTMLLVILEGLSITLINPKDERLR